ncbi:hypothetical protein [Streptomyces sirii]|uniref:hypothetical protein n=1 Tax=Streptomyces sirii TaxID=3127701 RepID=UPI003D36E6C9
MRARDLAVDYETVGLGSEALDAARLMAQHRLPGLLGVDEQGVPLPRPPGLPDAQSLVPGYVMEESTLASVVDERHSDRPCQALSDRTVRDCPPKTAPRRRSRPPTTPHWKSRH